jgi:hypothetical protein
MWNGSKKLGKLKNKFIRSKGTYYIDKNQEIDHVKYKSEAIVQNTEVSCVVSAVMYTSFCSFGFGYITVRQNILKWMLRNIIQSMYDVKLSRRLKLINSSRANSRVNSLKSNVSGTVSVPIIRAMIILWPERELQRDQASRQHQQRRWFQSQSESQSHVTADVEPLLGLMTRSISVGPGTRVWTCWNNTDAHQSGYRTKLNKHLTPPTSPPLARTRIRPRALGRCICGTFWPQ